MNVFQFQTVAQKKLFDIQSRNLPHFRFLTSTLSVEISKFVSMKVWKLLAKNSEIVITPYLGNTEQ